MVRIEGLLTVGEVAKRLNLSTEQVRRKLREGKMKGQRIGGQWFVNPASVDKARDGAEDEDEDRGWLISRALLRRIDENREAIFRENGIVYDVVAMLRGDRDSH